MVLGFVHRAQRWLRYRLCTINVTCCTGLPWHFLASLTFSEASLKIAEFWMFCPGFQANPTLSLAWNRSDSCTVARGEIAASFSQNVVRIPTSGQDRQTARHTDRGSHKHTRWPLQTIPQTQTDAPTMSINRDGVARKVPMLFSRAVRPLKCICEPNCVTLGRAS